MSIRYTLRRLKENECTIENLKNYELAVSTTNGRIVFRLDDVVRDLTGEASDGVINACRLWATSESSPDDASDSRSPTGKTMSARSWALEMIDNVNNALTGVQQNVQTINQSITTVNQKIGQANDTISQATTLLNRLIDITDADEVRY